MSRNRTKVQFKINTKDLNDSATRQKANTGQSALGGNRRPCTPDVMASYVPQYAPPPRTQRVPTNKIDPIKYGDDGSDSKSSEERDSFMAGPMMMNKKFHQRQKPDKIVYKDGQRETYKYMGEFMDRYIDELYGMDGGSDSCNDDESKEDNEIKERKNYKDDDEVGPGKCDLSCVFYNSLNGDIEVDERQADSAYFADVTKTPTTPSHSECSMSASTEMPKLEVRKRVEQHVDHSESERSCESESGSYTSISRSYEESTAKENTQREACLGKIGGRKYRKGGITPSTNETPVIQDNVIKKQSSSLNNTPKMSIKSIVSSCSNNEGTNTPNTDKITIKSKAKRIGFGKR